MARPTVRPPAAVLPGALLLAGLLLAGCGDGVTAGDEPDTRGTGRATNDPGPTPSDARVEVTRCADIPEEELPNDRELNTVLDAERGLLAISRSLGGDPNATVVVDFLTDPTCLPGTRVWAVIDDAASAAVEAGNNPWKQNVDYPHAV